MVEPLPLATLATACNAPLVGLAADTDVVVTGLAIDSRRVETGDLFVAIPGARQDGHAHVAGAADQGAVAALVLREVDVPLPQIRVEAIEPALAVFGTLTRAAYDGVVVGVTGSAGKTTAKNLIAAVLSEAGATRATVGNLNNELGVPLTLASLDADTQFAVVEMGAGKPGDIAWLQRMVQPTVAVLLNTAPAHIEHYPSLDAIAETKGAILDDLPTSALAVVNADQPWSAAWRDRAKPARVLTFGRDEAADIRVGAPVFKGFEGVEMTLVTPDYRCDIKLRLPGWQGVMNALAAAAVGYGLGLSSAAISRGLSGVAPGAGRGRVHRLASGDQLVDDSYNANPLAMAAAIDVLAGCSGRRRLVLGEMRELGADREALHHDSGRLARQRGLEECWVVGEGARAAAAGFGTGARFFENREALLAAVPTCEGADTTLVKASRGSALDEVVTAWLQSGEATEC